MRNKFQHVLEYVFSWFVLFALAVVIVTASFSPVKKIRFRLLSLSNKLFLCLETEEQKELYKRLEEEEFGARTIDR